MHDSGILVNRNSPVPLHRQLAAAFRDAILNGRLKPGERLLSSRDLKRHLGLSRNTVVEALEQLLAEGYIITVRGVGTFVSEVGRKSGTAPKRRARIAVEATAAANGYMAVKSLTETLGKAAPFRPGLPALELFPSDQFRRCFRSRDWGIELLDEPNALGYPLLREAIARRLEQTRGVFCNADQVVIMAGVQAALSLVVTVLMRCGDGAVTEDPGYPNVRAVFEARGMRVIPTAVDDDGLRVDLLPRKGARIVYVTPSHQYPSGAVLSLQRRFALLQWAEKYNAWIVEDDYDSEFSYTGRPQPALHGLAGGRRVLYVGTFSKVLSPAIRLAYLVVPPELKRSVESAHQVDGSVPSTILQSALAQFMVQGYFGRHITKMRKVYDDRRRFVAAKLGAADGYFRVRDSRAGLHFVAEMPRDINDVAFSAQAGKRGIIVPPLSKYFLGPRSRNGILVGFASAPQVKADVALATLRSIANAYT